MIKNGIYRHFKGNLYEVVNVAIHSETKEVMVIYRPLSNPTVLWVRPAFMWNEEILHEGKYVLRFQKIDE